MNGESDEELMGRFQQGNTYALEELVRRYADPLFGFLMRMTSNHALAQDLFQDTFLKVQTKAHSYTTNRKFKTWLYAIASNAAIDHHRRARWKTFFSLDAPAREDETPLMETLADPQPDPSAHAAQSDRARLVRDALGKLPPLQRATLALAYFEGLSYAEVAAALGCSVGTVKTQISRALDTLALLLPDPNTGGAA